MGLNPTKERGFVSPRELRVQPKISSLFRASRRPAGKARETLKSIISQVKAEWVQLQVVGRALTDEELRRSEVLSAVLNYLRTALSTLEDPGGPSRGDGDASTTPLKDGGYRGGNADLSVELRLDEAGSGVISGDFYRRHAGGETWVVSLRTPPGARVFLSKGSWDVVAEDQQRQITTGHLKLASEAPDPLSVVGVLRLDDALAGIPAQQDVTFTAEWRSEALRALGIELERQQGVAELPTFDFDGQDVTVESCFANAGFETFDVGQRTEIPDPPSPWGTAQLHALMSDHAQATLAIPEWELHLLLLSRSSLEGLLGVMFDTTASLPRQGSAVFADEIKDATGASHFPRKLIQTTVHELGHALNLAHRFERVLGRADSTSFMNYDWRYRGGGRRDEF